MTTYNMHCRNDGSSKHIFLDSNFKEGWVASKGQLISKWFFSSKKNRTETSITVVKSNSFVPELSLEGVLGGTLAPPGFQKRGHKEKWTVYHYQHSQI